jgi:hypothetical protein
MPDMPAFIAKGSLLKALDQYSLDRGNLQRLLGALEAAPNPDLAAIAQALGIGDADDWRHLREDWLGTNSWFTNPQDTTPVLVSGLAEAIRTALSPPKNHLPLDCYWVCSNEVGIDVSVAFTWNDRQVNVIFHTGPLVRGTVLGAGAVTADEPIKLVQRSGGSTRVTQLKHRP